MTLINNKFWTDNEFTDKVEETRDFLGQGDLYTKHVLNMFTNLRSLNIRPILTGINRQSIYFVTI